jgi:sortase A
VTSRSDGPWVPPAHPIQPAGSRFRPSLRAVALVLLGTGLLTCLVPFAVIAIGMWQEGQLTQNWAQSVATTPSETPAQGTPSAPAETPTPQPPPASQGPRSFVQAAFAIRVPKIGYYAAVREGVSTDVLATGPGHYPTTPMPGGTGLVGIAAHNTFWIPFGQLGPGDSVILETRAGRFTYRVTGTRIVNPDDTGVIVQTSDPRLVLTTCWPLWAGNLATQRLAIFAQQV